tara:strand:+ start:1717 stop:2982 length:1266 start_codon:yes stop_codon:yes gene_type:complete
MSEVDSEVVEQAQKQEIDSSIVVLWELQLKNDEYAHFFSGLEADLSTVQFRDREDSSVINSYTALPLEAEGFEVQSDGPAQRPTISFANVLSTFGDALQLSDGTVLTNKDLLGKKLYRRRTLYKYCYGQSGDSPDRSIEYPIQMYFVDRIADETPELIVFELASGFDLAGTMTPRRVITGNSCSWVYTGAAPEKTAAERVGGCSWSEYGRTVDRNGDVQTVYFNKKDEPIVHIDAVEATYSSGAVVHDRIYRTTADTSNFEKISSTGALTSAGTVYDYWQATRSTDTPGTPGDENANFRRVRVYDTYSASTTYNVYTNIEYNEYVAHDRGGEISPDPDTHTRIWQVSAKTQTGGSHNATPDHNSFWQLGEQCSKSLTGCALRFRCQFSDSGTASPEYKVPSTVLVQGQLPFGGFPGSKKFG